MRALNTKNDDDDYTCTVKVMPCTKYVIKQHNFTHTQIPKILLALKIIYHK